MGRVGLRAAARSPRKPHCVQHDPGASRERAVALARQTGLLVLTVPSQLELQAEAVLP